MKRAVIIVFVLIVLIAGALVVVPSFVDWNKYKDQIIAQLETATGYNYEIGGALEMAVLPYPHLSIEDLNITRPTPSGSFPLAKLDGASVQLALVPLFSGNVEVSKVQLVNPQFKLVIASNGAKSWITPTLEEKMRKKPGGATSSDLANAIALNAITVKNGSFSFEDQRGGGKSILLQDINLTLRGESLYGPYNLEGGFDYQGHQTEIQLNSGRIDKLAESIAAQLNLSFPAIASTVNYSGVVAFKDHLELQGETGIETQNLAKLVQVAGVKAPEYIQKPLSAKGILTLTDKEIAFRNMKAGFAGIEGTGHVIAKNFSDAEKAPLNIEVSFNTDKPYDLEALLPAKRKDSKNGLQGLLPETVTLPKEITGAVNINSATVTYQGQTYKDMAFSFDSRDEGFGGQLNLKAPGSTALDINSILKFSARSKSEKDGSVTYSDPVLEMESKLVSAEPVKLAEMFMKPPVDKKLANLLGHNLTSESKFKVKPRQIDIIAAFVKLAETRVNASGSYKLVNGANRDLLKLAVSNFGLDADQWIKKINGPGDAAAMPQKKADISEATKKLALPFDLDYSAEIQNLRLKGRDYSKLVSKGKLINKQLLLDSLELTSNAGDVFVMAGGIKDIAALDGVDLSMNARIVDIEQTLKSFEIDTSRLPSGVGRSDFLVEVKGQPEKMAFTANMKAMRATMEASGTVSDVLSTPKVSDLILRLQHPNYVEVARLYNPNFNSGVGIRKSLDIFASMNRKGSIYSFSQLQAVIGPANIKGDVVADLSKVKPEITAALQLSDLPLDDLLGIRTGKGSGTVQARTLQKNQDVRWSRNAINTDILHMANVALKATANTITYGDWNFKNAGINIDLKEGSLDIRQLDGGLYGGHVAMTGNLKSSPKPRQPIAFAGNFIVQDVSLEDFVRSFSGSQLVNAKGNVSLNADIKTSGLSPAALIFDLSGKGTASGSQLVFEGFDLARLSRALAEPSSSFTENFGRLLDASLQGGTTTFDKLDGAYTITEGVINFDKLDLTGPTADVVTKGTVSLPLWSLDLESTVQLKEPADAPPLRASFKGPIDKPAQTFGQNAMQQYFQRQLEGLVVNPLLEELEKKSGLPAGILGGTKKQPAPAPEQTQQAPAPEQPEQQQQQQPEPKRETTPEEAMFGIIQGIIGGQGQ